MIAFKGFTDEITSILGNGKKESCTFWEGKVFREDTSKTARNGFHCCENPFECLSYYPMNGKNRFFRVEAAGDIDEDNSERIACTEITLLKELSPLKFAMEGMKYIISHPDREKWEQHHGNVMVVRDRAETGRKDGIVIVRGENPRVRGPEGSILGLIREEKGIIRDCKLFVQKAELADKWCGLSGDRTVKEVQL